MVFGLLVRHTIPALSGSAVGLLIIAVAVYISFGVTVLLPAIPAVLAWLGSGGLTNRIMHAASNRSRALLRKSFEYYVPPAVVARTLASRTLPKLSGERREISVVFTDVAGFTSLAETVEPEFLVNLYSDYFEGVCAGIVEQGGMVNEFVGDAMLAFFGAHTHQPDHADRATSAALAINRFACRFSAEWEARGVDFGHTRVSAHTGAAWVGNIGTRARLKFGAQGDVLNTGSRLEALNKTIGTRICVSGETVSKTVRYRFRPIGTFVLKGRSQATEVFEPVDPERNNTDRLARYEVAFRALQDLQPNAAEQFAALRREDPDDPCVAFHCQRLAAGASGIIIVMTEK